MIDMGTVITVATTVAGAGGGYVSGRQVNRVQKESLEAQSAALEALKVRIEEQERRLLLIPDLESRIALLTEMVTQRADVESVKELVLEIKERLGA